MLLVDLDLGMRNLDLYLGLENKVVYNVMDIFSGTCNISRALIQDARFQNLSFLSACPRRDNRDVTPLHMEVLCDRMKNNFDYILLDCPAGIGEGVDIALAVAHKALLVSEPDVAAVRDADVLNRYLLAQRFKKTHYIINKVRSQYIEQGMLMNVKQISEMINSQLIGIIPEDDNIYLSTNKGIPISMKQGSYIEKNLSNILNRLLER